MTTTLRALDMKDREHVWRSVNSYLGVLSHYASYNLRTQLFMTPELMKIGYFDHDMLNFHLW